MGVDDMTVMEHNIYYRVLWKVNENSSWDDDLSGFGYYATDTDEALRRAETLKENGIPTIQIVRVVETREESVISDVEMRLARIEAKLKALTI